MQDIIWRRIFPFWVFYDKATIPRRIASVGNIPALSLLGVLRRPQLLRLHGGPGSVLTNLQDPPNHWKRASVPALEPII